MELHARLQDFVYVNYAVPKQRLQKHIPKPLKLITKKINKKECGFVSVVYFRYKDLHWIPYPRFNFGQVNYRTYVRDKQGKKAVYFLKTTLDSRKYTAFARFFLRAPVKSSKLVTFGIHRAVKIKNKTGPGLNLSLLKETTFSLPKGFTSREALLSFFAQIPLGYYSTPESMLMKIRVKHLKPKFIPCTLNNAYFKVLEQLKLLNKAEMKKPHSVFSLKDLDFEIGRPTPAE